MRNLSSHNSVLSEVHSVWSAVRMSCHTRTAVGRFSRREIWQTWHFCAICIEIIWAVPWYRVQIQCFWEYKHMLRFIVHHFIYVWARWFSIEKWVWLIKNEPSTSLESGNKDGYRDASCYSCTIVDLTVIFLLYSTRFVLTSNSQAWLKKAVKAYFFQASYYPERTTLDKDSRWSKEKWHTFGTYCNANQLLNIYILFFFSKICF